MRAVFTVYFEGPFWVGLLESESEEGLVVAREVFGAEPTNAELLDFLLNRFSFMRRSVPRTASVRADSALPRTAPCNPKRAIREAAREMRSQPSTKAQAALKAARDGARTEDKGKKREERLAAEAADFQRRAEKRKRKRRGH